MGHVIFICSLRVFLAKFSTKVFSSLNLILCIYFFVVVVVRDSLKLVSHSLAGNGFGFLTL